MQHDFCSRSSIFYFLQLESLIETFIVQSFILILALQKKASLPCVFVSTYSLSNKGSFCVKGAVVSPHLWADERVPPQHGPRLSVGQIGCWLPVDGQDEVADAQTSVAADGSTLDYTADQHSQTLFHGAHCHP